MVARLAVNEKVAGSSPAGGADDSCESDPFPSRFVREMAMG